MDDVARPAAALAPFVRCYVQLAVSCRRAGPAADPGAQRTHSRVHPRQSARGPGTEQAGRKMARACNVVGVETYRARVELSMHGDLQDFVILFQPGGLSALLSVPGDYLADRHLDGRAVCGASVDDLRESTGRLVVAAGATTARARACSFDIPRAARIRAWPTSCARAARPEQQPADHWPGRTVRPELASIRGQICRARGRRRGGLPGTSAVKQALERRTAGARARWTDVARGLGYKRWGPLMVRDFSLLAGATPSTVAPELRHHRPRRRRPRGPDRPAAGPSDPHPLLTSMSIDPPAIYTDLHRPHQQGAYLP